MSSKWQKILREELGGFSIRAALATTVARCLLPVDAFPRLRTVIYRAAGMQIGHGTIITGNLHVTGGRAATRNLRIGRSCYLNDEITINAGAAVHLGDGVSLGMQCLLITAGHEVGDACFRAGAISVEPIRVGDGCWLAARVTVLPGVNIGTGSIVAAGALVNKDIPANVLVAGVPARILRKLEPSQ